MATSTTAKGDGGWSPGRHGCLHADGHHVIMCYLWTNEDRVPAPSAPTFDISQRTKEEGAPYAGGARRLPYVEDIGAI
jgi:hypothetical protein